LTAALSGGGVSVAMSSQRQHEPATDAGAQAYALCKSELERQAGEITRLSKQLGEFQGFFYGYLRATGVEVPLPPGSPPPAKVEIQTVPDPKAEVAPVMAAPRRGGVPRPARLRVLTEPPVAPAAPRPPDLPELLPGPTKWSSPAPTCSTPQPAVLTAYGDSGSTSARQKRTAGTRIRR